MDLEVKAKVTDTSLSLEPVFQLFGRVSCPIVQNENHVLDAAPERFRKDRLLHKGLEIDETFAASAGSIHLAIGNREASKQVACAATMIARLVQYRFASLCRVRRLLTLAGLNGGFLIQADEPSPGLQEHLRLNVCFEHGTGAQQEGDGIMDMLPVMIAPGTKPFRFEPAPHRTR